MTYIGGWTCAKCGSFVQQGGLHSCGTPSTTPSSPHQPQTAYGPAEPSPFLIYPPAPAVSAQVALNPTPTYARIAAALERIAKSLEEIVYEEYGPPRQAK